MKKCLFLLVIILGSINLTAYGQTSNKATQDSIRDARLAASKLRLAVSQARNDSLKRARETRLETARAKKEEANRARQIKMALRGIKSIDTITVEIGHLNLSEWISAGEYRLADDDINMKRFDIQFSGGPTKVDAAIIHIGKSFNSLAYAENTLKKLYLFPAPLEYLLAIGAKHPEMQKEFPIVAMGWKEKNKITKTYVTILDYRKGEISGEMGRILGLEWRDQQWEKDIRFLAVFEPIEEEKPKK